MLGCPNVSGKYHKDPSRSHFRRKPSPYSLFRSRKISKVPFWWHMAPHRLRPWMQWMLEMLVKPQRLIAHPLTIGPVQPKASSTQYLSRHTYWIFFLNHTWYDHALFVPICPASERKLAKDARDTDLALPSDSSCKKGTRRIKALKGSCSNMFHFFARETGCCNFIYFYVVKYEYLLHSIENPYT